MDDSPIPRCIFKIILIVACLLFVVILAGIDTYGNLQDSNCLSFTSVSDSKYIGIMYKVGILVPLCCCAFFALENRVKLLVKKTPSLCRCEKILNC